MAYRGKKGIYFKVCLIGDGGVGKTSLRENLLGREFVSTYLLTIGADFAVYKTIIEGKEYKLQIWDLAGQQRFNAVREVYYKGSHAAIMVFDQTRPESLSNLEKWKNELFTHVGRKVPFIVLGNKNDLKSNIDQTSIDKFLNHSEKDFNSIKDNYNIPYLSTSSRTGQNVKEAFQTLANIIKDFQ